MKTVITASLFMLMCGSLLIAACGGGGKSGNDGKTTSKDDKTMRLPVPDTFKDKQPTTSLTDAAFIEKGKLLFHDAAKANCLMCHGDGGKGDGPQAPTYIDPKVADLTNPAFQDAVTDQYIFWRLKDVANSKAYPNSGMLGYQNGTDDEIWSLVAYVRSLKGK
jgi:mono/diheme cytochrome c family protein